MAHNEENLKKINSEEMAREYQKKSVESRNRNTEERRSLKLALEILLEKEFTDKSGQKVSGATAIATKLFEQAMKGNVKAFETLRDTAGQKPVERVEQLNTDIVIDFGVHDDTDQ